MTRIAESATAGASSHSRTEWDALVVLNDRLGRLGKNYSRREHLAGGLVTVDFPDVTFKGKKLLLSASVEISCLTGTVTEKAAKRAAKAILRPIVADAQAEMKRRSYPEMEILYHLPVHTRGIGDTFEKC